MQRLSSLVATRVGAYTGLTAAATAASARYVNKGAQKNLNDNDSRWLEAEIDENINTPEERYAHQKDVENLRRLVAKLHNEQEVKIKETANARNQEVENLKSQMKELERKLKEATKDN